MADGIRRGGAPDVTNVHKSVIAQAHQQQQGVTPNKRRADAREQPKGGQDERHKLAAALKSLTDTGIVRTVNRLTGRRNLPTVAPGQDNVLLNVGTRGVHTFAMGSLRPVIYQKRFEKSLMGRRIRVTGPIPEEWDDQVDGEMTNARMNRPMNRDLLAMGHYDGTT
jgi:hypothetical protein